MTEVQIHTLHRRRTMHSSSPARLLPVANTRSSRRTHTFEPQFSHCFHAAPRNTNLPCPLSCCTRQLVNFRESMGRCEGVKMAPFSTARPLIRCDRRTWCSFNAAHPGGFKTKTIHEGRCTGAAAVHARSQLEAVDCPLFGLRSCRGPAGSGKADGK